MKDKLKTACLQNVITFVSLTKWHVNVNLAFITNRYRALLTRMYNLPKLDSMRDQRTFHTQNKVKLYKNSFGLQFRYSRNSRQLKRATLVDESLK